MQQQQQQHSYWNISKSAVPFNSGLDQSGNVLSHGLGAVFPERKFLVSYARQRHTSIPPFPYLPQQTSANRFLSKPLNVIKGFLQNLPPQPLVNQAQIVPEYDLREIYEEYSRLEVRAGNV